MTRIAVALAVLAGLLAFASPTLAQVQTRGSTLQTPAHPNNASDCAFLYSSQSPNPIPNPWGATSCTYFQGYVFGNTADTRTGFVPRDGVINTVTVRSGPNPAPLRFVIVRQLTNAQLGAVSGEPKCCFFVRETPPVQPAPNTNTTFTVDLPVENNVQPNVITQDIIGFSAPVGGTLPIAFLPQFTDLAYSAGVVTAESFHPAVNAAQHGTGTGGAFASHHYSGLEVLLQYTFSPRAGVVSPGGPGAPIPTNLLAIGGPSVLRPIDGALDVILNCLQANCSGTVDVLTRRPVAAAAAAKRKPAKKIRSLGSRRFSVKQGSKRKVKVELNRLGRKLAKRKSTKVTVVVKLGKAGKVTKNRTLKPAKPAKRKRR
jgi:hypothetical protein